MTFRDLALARVHTNDPAWLTIHDGDRFIGEAIRNQDGRWTVTLDNGVSSHLVGLDDCRAMFADLDSLRDWARDVHLRSIHSAVHRLSDVDLQRLRGMAADAVTNRVALAVADARR